MFFGRKYPYSNLHDLNLDWIISEISSLKEADAEALARILEQGVSGDSFKWRAQENTLIVTDNYDAELYRVIWDENGFTMTRNGGTPVTYRVASGTLTAPTINATALRAGSANITGTVAAGEIHTTTPVAVQYGGTGATTAGAALSNLGGVPAARTVNGKALSADIVLTASDVNAMPDSAQALASGTDLNSLNTGIYSATAAVQPSLLNAPWALNLQVIYCVFKSNNAAAIEQYAFAGQRTAHRFYDGSTWSDWNLNRQLNSTSGSGTIPGCIPAQGFWMLTVMDDDNTHFYMGIVQRNSTGTSQLALLGNSSIAFTGGNAVGTVILSGATGTVRAVAKQLTF